ncbi:MAG TPA: hypothetical protein VJQ47_18790 [Steroidobacteraceae bacterium]|nr:hypothetical protein [Steroidobacteraceae bacterium]
MDHKLDDLNRWLAIFSAADGLVASATAMVGPESGFDTQRGQRLSLEAVRVVAGTATRYREEVTRITLDSLGPVALASEFTGRARVTLR